MSNRSLGWSLVASTMLIMALFHTADCSKYSYFDDFLFDSLNAGNSVLKPRGKYSQHASRAAATAAAVSSTSRTSNELRTQLPTTVVPVQNKKANATAGGLNAAPKHSSFARQPTASSGTTKRRGTAASSWLPLQLKMSREQPVVAATALEQVTVATTAAPSASGFGRFKPHSTATPASRLRTTASSDEDDDDDDEDDSREDTDDDTEDDSDETGSGDRSSENYDKDDDDDFTKKPRMNKATQKKHAKRQSSGLATRQRDTAPNRGRGSAESDLERMRDVPQEHWSCCMLGKLAGDKGFDCHAQFYNRRLLDRNVNRAHNRRLSDTYFANGRTTPGAMQLMTLFSTCVRSHEAEFHDCCREALDETVERRERWRRFEQVVQEVRIARQ